MGADRAGEPTAIAQENRQRSEAGVTKREDAHVKRMQSLERELDAIRASTREDAQLRRMQSLERELDAIRATTVSFEMNMLGDESMRDF
ncbi:hypothetical protein T484DRAFT_1832168 [Baffinella frigidus]|nr:hypothetical protein T484DRAFT_1832168 [Cryptophyta sp. CCMP2293]